MILLLLLLLLSLLLLLLLLFLLENTTTNKKQNHFFILIIKMQCAFGLIVCLHSFQDHLPGLWKKKLQPPFSQNSVSQSSYIFLNLLPRL